MAPSALGRPASKLVAEQGPNSDRGQETFCSIVPASVDNSGFGLSEGGGGLAGKTERGAGGRKECSGGGGSSSKAKPQTPAGPRGKRSSECGISLDRGQQMSGAAAPMSGDCTSPSDRCCQDPDRGQLPHSLPAVGALSGASSSCGVQQAQYDSTDGDSDRAARNEQPVIGSPLSSEDRLPCMVSGSQVTNPAGVRTEFQNEVLENFAREGDVSTIRGSKVLTATESRGVT